MSRACHSDTRLCAPMKSCVLNLLCILINIHTYIKCHQYDMYSVSIMYVLCITLCALSAEHAAQEHHVTYTNMTIICILCIQYISNHI